MDRLSEYSSLISPAGAAAFAGVAIAVILVAPRRIRLEVSLAATAVVLTVGRLPDLGIVADLAKLGSGFMLLLVAFAAVQRPGRKLPVPVVCWGYVIVGILSVIFVLHTVDHTYAVALRGQWLVLAVSAVLTARTVVDARALRRILLALLWGMTIGGLITASALATDLTVAIHNGFGRFMPYGCNPNQIGVMYAVTAALGLYFSLTAKTPAGRALAIGCTVLAVTQSVLTVSRASFLIIALTATPSLFRAFQRPLFAILTSGLMVIAFYTLAVYAESCDFDRVSSNVSGRKYKTLDVLEEVRLRPYAGLGSTHGLYAFDPELNAHNAYVSMLYLGGITVGLPLFALQLYGYYCMAGTWLNRHRLPIDSLLITVLSGLSVALLIHGFINEIIYYPTYMWAFLNVFTSCLFIILKRYVRQARIAAVKAAETPPSVRQSVPALPRRLQQHRWPNTATAKR